MGYRKPKNGLPKKWALGNTVYFRYHELVEFLKANIYALSETYKAAKQSEDIDKCQNLCRLFTELGETLLEMICNLPGEGILQKFNRILAHFFGNFVTFIFGVLE